MAMRADPKWSTRFRSDPVLCEEKQAKMNDRVMTILVIDDEPALRESISYYLEDRDFRVITAENGRVGLEVFEREHPDLVLTDLRMPEVDGLEVLRRVGEISPETPVIVVSGTGQISDSIEALRCGAWDYILKPIDDLSILSLATDRALERTRLKRENRVYQENLEALVHERTAELEQANKWMANIIAELRLAKREREELIVALEAQNAQLERFAYAVSHDLKTPLITIKGHLGALSEDVRSGNMEFAEQDMGFISGAADRMGALLQDVLDLSRIGHLVNPPCDVSLVDLVNEALEFLPDQARGAVQVDVAPDLPMVYGDRERLLEVLQNLIENAVKYMGDQPEPRIEIGRRVDGQDEVFFVRDNGIGIKRCYHEKIFSLFDQLDRNVDGTGIGLTLVKRIIEVHGGRIWVESSGPGHGSTFCFTIAPKAEAPELKTDKTMAGE